MKSLVARINVAEIQTPTPEQTQVRLSTPEPFWLDMGWLFAQWIPLFFYSCSEEPYVPASLKLPLAFALLAFINLLLIPWLWRSHRAQVVRYLHQRRGVLRPLASECEVWNRRLLGLRVSTVLIMIGVGTMLAVSLLVAREITGREALTGDTMMGGLIAYLLGVLLTLLFSSVLAPSAKLRS